MEVLVSVQIEVRCASCGSTAVLPQPRVMPWAEEHWDPRLVAVLCEGQRWIPKGGPCRLT